ncbi:protein aveugle-like [Liolophura sinensis]|uniref:protein aveugle-like n=1 Tax=Liolophura sinensis TaxID=3198878 RepID=UPI0031598B1C
MVMVIAVMEGFVKVPPGRAGPLMCDKAISAEQMVTPVPLKPKEVKKTPKSKSKPLYFWNSADVNKWLKKHGGQCFDLYGELFLEHDVTGRTLIRLNEIKLEKMGVTNPVHNAELMKQILQQRLRHEAVETRTLDQKRSGFELKLPDTKTAKG